MLIWSRWTYISFRFRINENNTGAPAYRPQLKLKIYVYGYLNRIRSSRRLERECKRNLELMWLTEGPAPEYEIEAFVYEEQQDLYRCP